MEDKREKRITQITIELSIAWGLISWFFLLFYVSPHIYKDICPWYTVLTCNLILISNIMAFIPLLILKSLISIQPTPLFLAEVIGYSLSLIFQVATYFYLGRLISVLLITNQLLNRKNIPSPYEKAAILTCFFMIHRPLHAGGGMDRVQECSVNADAALSLGLYTLNSLLKETKIIISVPTMHYKKNLLECIIKIRDQSEIDWLSLIYESLAIYALTTKQ
jgi:hypothetical protein